MVFTAVPNAVATDVDAMEDNLLGRYSMKSTSPWSVLRATQKEALDLMRLKENRDGLYELPCGTGKTCVGVCGAIQHGNKILVVCKTHEACTSFYNAFCEFTTFPGDRIFHIGKGKEDDASTERMLNKMEEEDSPGESPAFCIIGTYQGFADSGNKCRSDNAHRRRNAFLNVVWDVRVLDEVHSAPASTFRKFLEKDGGGCASRYTRTIGLTGTLVRDDNLEKRQKTRESDEMDIRKVSPDISYAEMEERIEEKYFQEDFGWMHARRAIRKTMMEMQTEGCIALMNFAKVSVPLTKVEKSVLDAAKDKGNNAQTSIYIMELCSGKINAIEAIARLHFACGDQVAIFVEHTAAARILAQTLNLPVMTSDAKFENKIKDMMPKDGTSESEAKVEVCSTPEKRLALIDRINKGEGLGFITTRVGNESLDITSPRFRVGIRCGHGGRSGLGQTAGRTARTLPSGPQKSAFFYDLYTEGTPEENQCDRRLSFVEAQGYRVRQAEGSFFVEKAKAMGLDVSWYTDEQKYILCEEVSKIYTNDKNEKETQTLLSEIKKAWSKAISEKKEAVRKKNDKMRASGAPEAGIKTMESYRNKNCTKSVNSLKRERAARIEDVKRQRANKKDDSSNSLFEGGLSNANFLS